MPTIPRSVGELTNDFFLRISGLHRLPRLALSSFLDERIQRYLTSAERVSEQKAFLRGIESDPSPKQNTVEQGLTVQRVSDAIYRSAEDDHAVRLPEDGRNESEIR